MSDGWYKPHHNESSRDYISAMDAQGDNRCPATLIEPQTPRKSPASLGADFWGLTIFALAAIVFQFIGNTVGFS